jgi:hypothetical protein
MSGRVVFLDIDGPVIPFSMFLINPMASADRILAPIPLAVLRVLCEKSGALVVFNSTHNQSWDDIPDIDEQMIAYGFSADFIHSDMKTKYPTLSREDAVLEWLSRHPNIDDWIAFDDARFTDAENLIWVDPDAGLHLGHLNKALDRWSCSQFLVL